MEIIDYDLNMRYALRNRPTYLNHLIACSNSDFVKILLGVRRCGKSTLLDLLSEYLLKTGVAEENIIKINFEKIEFNDLKDAKAMHRYLDKRITNKQKYYLFIDEVQEMDDWPICINSIRVSYDIDIYVTGSNSRIFSGEAMTYLTGRYVAINIYPLSYYEYLAFAGLDFKGDHYNDFLASSFPAIVLEKDDDIKEMLIDSLYEAIFERDIILRGKIDNPSVFLKVAVFMFSNVGNTVSVKSISDAFKDQKINISVVAVDNYLGLMCKAHCLYQCRRYDIKGKEILKTNGKYYAVDLGLRTNMVPNTKTDTGHVFENFVYLELIKHGYRVYTGKVDRNYEIDFVAIKKRQTIYIQVSESVLDKATREREIRPFSSIKDHRPAYLVTRDESTFDFDCCKHYNYRTFLERLEKDDLL